MERMTEQRELADCEQNNLELEVLQNNYSILYWAISACDIVPALFSSKLITCSEMEEINSHSNSGAKNTALLAALRRRPHPLHQFCHILSTTPGQEDLAKQLLHDYEELEGQEHYRYARKRSSASDSKSISRKRVKRLAPSSKSFGLLLIDLTTILDGNQDAVARDAVARMKMLLKSMTLPLKDKGELSAVINSPKYENATTATELFDALAPCWNECDCDLLDLLVRASCSEAAIKKVEKFLEERDPDMPLVVQAVDSDATTPEGAAEFKVRIAGEHVTRDKMLDTKEVFCRSHHIPKEFMVGGKYRLGSITLIFYISIKLIQYLHAQVLGLREVYSLRRCGVFEIIGPDQYHVIIPPLKHLEYLQASMFGYRVKVLSMIGSGVPVNVTTPDGVSALMLASQEGHEQVVDTLLERSASLNLQSKNGSTALIKAAYRGHHHVVELLLRAGASPDHQKKNGDTALTIAAFCGHHQVVELLVRSGASPDHQKKDGFSALMCASQEGHQQVVDVLLRHGASPHLHTQSDGTALIKAASHGHYQVVELLLRAEASPDHQKDDGFSALMLASKEGHEQVVNVLLGHRANPNLRSEDGFSALMLASKEGHEQVVDVLLGHRANPNLRSENGDTALTNAFFKGHHQIVELLLKAGASPDQLKEELLLGVARTKVCLGTKEAEIKLKIGWQRRSGLISPSSSGSISPSSATSSESIVIPLSQASSRSSMYPLSRASSVRSNMHPSSRASSVRSNIRPSSRASISSRASSGSIGPHFE